MYLAFNEWQTPTSQPPSPTCSAGNQEEGAALRHPGSKHKITHPQHFSNLAHPDSTFHLRGHRALLPFALRLEKHFYSDRESPEQQQTAVPQKRFEVHL